MTEREKERLLAYIVNELIRLENRVIDCQRAFAKYSTYEMYCYELFSSMIELHTFQKISADILEILGLSVGDTSDKEE